MSNYKMIIVQTYIHTPAFVFPHKNLYLIFYIKL